MTGLFNKYFFTGIKSNIHFMNKSEKKLTELLKEEVSANKTSQKSSYTGRTSRQIMTKHILDKNDMITEDDFNNLNISIDISNDTSHKVLDIPDHKERPKDEDKDPAIIVPWDIIS
jgi:hypothetical protein